MDHHSGRRKGVGGPVLSAMACLAISLTHARKHSGPWVDVAAGDRGYVSASGAVLPWWLCVVSGMIAGCDRCAAGDPRDALIREQAEAGSAAIAAQAEQIAALEAVVADLREQLEAAERAGSRNSGNSSMPPWSDDLPGRKPPRKQRRAAERAEKKKRGKQPGAPGAAMTWEVPDRTEDHYPEGSLRVRP